MEEGKGQEGPPLFSHKPRASSQAAAASGISDAANVASSTTRGAASSIGVDLQRKFNERLRGGFGVLLALNLFLGGYMLFQGKRARRIEAEEEEEEERTRHHNHKAHHNSHKGPYREPHNKEGSKEGGQREGYRERERAVEKQRGEEQQQRAQVQEGKVVEESHIAEKLLWARDDLDEYLDRCLSFDAGAPPRRPAKAVSYNEQMAVLQWILEEKRREHPATRLEKRRIDADKRLLKDLMRSGKRLPLRDM